MLDSLPEPRVGVQPQEPEFVRTQARGLLSGDIDPMAVLPEDRRRLGSRGGRPAERCQ